MIWVKRRENVGSVCSQIKRGSAEIFQHSDRRQISFNFLFWDDIESCSILCGVAEFSSWCLLQLYFYSKCDRNVERDVSHATGDLGISCTIYLWMLLYVIIFDRFSPTPLTTCVREGLHLQKFALVLKHLWTRNFFFFFNFPCLGLGWKGPLEVI